MISCSIRRGVIYVRLHAIFAAAPEPVLAAVAQFVGGPKPPEDEASSLIDAWVERHRHLVKHPCRQPPLLPRGEVHDLQRIFDDLNQRYFQGRVTARITWSVAARKQRRRSIRMGSYSEEERLIRIHPSLDQSFVPEYFVAAVVFHEMLHEIHGPREKTGPRRVHSAAFCRDEARFAEHAKARAWEAENLHRLLRY